MRTNIFETLVGFFVFLLAGGLLAYAYIYTHQGQSAHGYIIKAKFDRVDGLVVGSDVKIGGIKVGTVDRQVLDPDSYMAEVDILLSPSIKLPEDTSARVSSEGLLGGKFLDIVPGGGEKMIQEGGVIQHTQSSLNLESLIGQAVFSKQDASKSDAPSL